MTIGLLLPNISYPLGKSLFDGVKSAAEETGDRIVCFSGSAVIKEHRYPLYDLALNPDIESLIVYGGGLGQFLNREQLSHFLQRLSVKPMLNIGYRVGGFNNIGVDNYSGMKSIMNHLIQSHGHRRIAFVRGPSRHPEALERHQAYKDSLESEGIPFQDELVIPGDFTAESGRQAAIPLIRLLDEERISAVAFSCDTMASACMTELIRRGVSLPHDLALTGFDNSDEALSRLPGLTTVDQGAHNLGRESLFKIREIARLNLSDVDEILPVQTVQRESCGCIPDMIKKVTDSTPHSLSSLLPLHPLLLERIDEKSRKKMEDLLHSDLRMETDHAFLEFLSTFRPAMEFFNNSPSIDFPMRIFQDFISGQRQALEQDGKFRQEGMERVLHQMRVFIHMQSEYALTSRRVQGDYLMRSLNGISNQFISISSFDEIKTLLDQYLENYKVEACGISLYEIDKVSEYRIEYLYSEERLPLAIPFGYENVQLIPPELMSYWRKGAVILRPLYSHHQYWGFMFFVFREKLSVNDGVFIESLSSQIASAITQIRLLEERNQAEEKLRDAYRGLEKANRNLENLSYRDVLTKLYNRRGFMELSGKMINECREEEWDFLIMYGDLDGLKIINDRYGHKEGDFAISSIAGIIASACRESDIIARLGGDEFVAMIPHVPADYKTVLRRRLQRASEELNGNSGRDFTVSCSFGMVLGSEYPHQDLQALMSIADKRLYLEKKGKKERG